MCNSKGRLLKAIVQTVSILSRSPLARTSNLIAIPTSTLTRLYFLRHGHPTRYLKLRHVLVLAVI